MDGDGDTDVVAAIGRAFLTDANSVVFYRNGDASGGGLGLSWTRIEVADSTPLEGVRAADVDGDGDIDIISSSNDGGNGRIAWHRNGDSNGGGDGSSWTLVEIGSTGRVPNNFPHAVRAGDIDGDGDLDVISNTTGEVVWHQNGDGSGNGDGSLWSSTSVVGEGLFASSLAIDVDGDSDLDIISGGPIVSLFPKRMSPGTEMETPTEMETAVVDSGGDF